MMSERMNIGTTGLVSMEGGWLYNTHTGMRISPKGEVFNKEGELVFPPREDEDEDEGESEDE